MIESIEAEYVGGDPARVYVGLDIGCTKLMVAAADDRGMILRRVRAATPYALDEGLSRLHQMIAEVADGAPVMGIGAAIGGPLDVRRGVVSPLHQPQWRDVPLKALMEERWGCSFAVDVDTNVAALGEYAAGGGATDRFLYVTLSTGMGGGFLIDGQIYHEIRGAHPEVAHQAIPFQCSFPERVVCVRRSELPGGVGFGKWHPTDLRQGSGAPERRGVERG